MATNPYNNFDEALVNSSSSEDESPILPKVGTRQKTRGSHVPIEAKVNVTNGVQDRDLGSGNRHQVVQVT